MKKMFFLVSVFAINLAIAQKQNAKFAIDKGTWYLGGNMSIYHSNGDENYNNTTQVNRDWKNDSYTLSPMIGFAINKNLITGLGLSYNNSNRNSSNTSDLNGEERNEYTIESVGIIPFVRAYRGIGDKLGLYLQGEVNYSKNWSDNKFGNQYDYASDGTKFFIGLRPGISFLIADKFALEASIGSLGYTRQESKGDNSDYESDSFSLSLSSSDLLFGLAYYF